MLANGLTNEKGEYLSEKEKLTDPRYQGYMEELTYLYDVMQNSKRTSSIDPNGFGITMYGEGSEGLNQIREDGGFAEDIFVDLAEYGDNIALMAVHPALAGIHNGVNESAEAIYYSTKAGADLDEAYENSYRDGTIGGFVGAVNSSKITNTEIAKKLMKNQQVMQLITDAAINFTLDDTRRYLKSLDIDDTAFSDDEVGMFADELNRGYSESIRPEYTGKEDSVGYGVRMAILNKLF